MTPSLIVQPTTAGLCGGAPGAAPRPAGTTQPVKSWPLNSGFHSSDPALISRGAATLPMATTMAASAAMEAVARAQRTIAFIDSSLQCGDDNVIDLLRAFVAVARFDRVEALVSQLAFQESDCRRQIPAGVDARVHAAGGHRKHRLQARVQLFLVGRVRAADVDVRVRAGAFDDLGEQRPDDRAWRWRRRRSRVGRGPSPAAAATAS